MKRKKIVNVEKKYIIMIIIAIIMIVLAILSYGLKKKKELNIVESFLKDAIVSVENVIFYPFRFTINLFDNYSSLKDIKEENDILKTSLNRIESIEAENIELRRQLKSLKEELNIDYTLTDYEYLNATVTSRNIGYWYNTITIDKGSNSGIEIDMPVINAYGLLGKVINTTSLTSTVRLITTSDTNNKISVSIISDGEKLNGLINGYNFEDSTLEVEGISNTKTVRVGDLVYTSGLGGVFPSGILIGKVESITTDSYDLSKIINVKPSAEFDDINYVTILKRKTDAK